MAHTPHEVPRHKKHTLKLLGITSRLQTLMINENLTPDELVSCAEAAKRSYETVKAPFTQGQAEL